MTIYRTCSRCREPFEAIGVHWVHKPNHAPRPTRRQVEVVTGLLLGAGAYTGPLNAPSVQLTVENVQLAEWISDELTSLGANVQKKHNQYYVSTPSNPALKSYFQNWYSNQEEPEPPSTSILTPMIASVWFAVNGSPQNGAIHLKASYSNQNLGWHRELFREIGLNPWREDPKLIFPVEQAKDLIDYLSDSLSSAETKWEAIR